MAAIMDEWNKIAAHCRKIGDTLGVEVPPILYKVEGDVWARQNQRLSALSAFLQDVSGQAQALKSASNTGETLPLEPPKKNRKTTRVLTDV